MKHALLLPFVLLFCGLPSAVLLSAPPNILVLYADDLAAAHPEKVAELQALLGRIREQGHSAPRLQNTKR